jgi:hypothetical protein
MTIHRSILAGLAGAQADAVPVSRREALRQGGAWTTAAAVATAPVLLTGAVRNVFAQSPALSQQIVDALNLALLLERTDSTFYRQGLETPGLIPESDIHVWGQIVRNETAHVALLEQTLGPQAAPPPTLDFTAGGQLGDAFSNYETFLAVAQGFEDLGVRAYKGQAPNLVENDAILTTALQIHSVEARQAAIVRRLRGQKPWITGNETDVPLLAPIYAGEETTNGTAAGAAGTEAFDEPLSADQVRAIAGVFIREQA